MIKNSRIEPGKTPSLISGKTSTKVEEGEPLATGEEISTDRTVEKAASILREDVEESSK